MPRTNARLLFSPLTLRGLTLRNRIVISPMCQHAADQGKATDWHLVHLGKFAMGGAGLIFTESTAVSPHGRIGIDDLGLWSDDQIEPLKRVIDFVHDQGVPVGVQLAHAGRKAGSQPLWEGGQAFTLEDMHFPDGTPWRRIGPSPVAAGPEWSVPEPLDESDIRDVADQFAASAARAVAAGVDAIELHFGHGYLLASFLSPISNHRSDAYGGSRDNRMRLALEIAERVRSGIPDGMPLFCRLSAIDGAEGGWSVDDSVHLARDLSNVGVDVIDVSSGGLSEETRRSNVPRGLGFQVGFANDIKRGAGVVTQAVGMIVDGRQAEDILQSGAADLVAIAREALNDPYWPRRAREMLGLDPDYSDWPARYGSWLSRRDSQIGDELRARREFIRSSAGNNADNDKGN
ncbi:NADH:flavin oxidoreductase/NADH oxidase [Tardiphaga sp. vice352]|uniref:NADH:flavin oxidoreductase/NADH oxidase n=1 Tax=unclassified Tardiphaga TaxID=2631404 RepID=UPI001164C888|nr:MULTISPECIES: NADH:flavin oxidoreductase/NADH oxidase [unclassified Tardiphaga]QDM17178.1 NADH:flavin oxidoreductase/NADH oxidase [Tardiphaga sp. vice278]QDM22161.1 NADH:flavin oxidoreductase/NADH oxidase [Tardiphaga sp. vice154]QDM27415.1 NADH:flavin oxidoreductase/NADH oxidase [Tardiphaga sp. vice304]QDM32541.1 NADH:flavin oxidoreductase/NADH oxidase [Tardiphaga sp. vice352]